MDFQTLHEHELSLMKKILVIKNPLLDQIMLLLNYIDTLPGYILVITLTWFCFRRDFGLRLLFLFFITSFINQDAKELLAQPRPCQMDPSLLMVKAKSFGIPSGAAQSMLVIWGYAAWFFRKKIFTFLAVFAILLISFSRIYLGLHFFSDILAGWILGGITLIVYVMYEPTVTKKILSLSKKEQLILILGVTWVFASLALNKNSSLVVFSSLGVMLGLLFSKKVPKDPKNWKQRIERIAVVFFGVVGLLCLTFLLPAKPHILEKIFGKGIQTFAGFWIGFLVNPLILKIEKLRFFS